MRINGVHDGVVFQQKTLSLESIKNASPFWDVLPEVRYTWWINNKFDMEVTSTCGGVTGGFILI